MARWRSMRSSQKAIPRSLYKWKNRYPKQEVHNLRKQLRSLLNSFTDFYSIFWSLQLHFSKPLLFATPGTFAEFKDAVTKVLPVIREATTKERAMMGSRSTGHAGSLKRKREPETAEESSGSEYFFAKFLTSPDLLDLEVIHPSLMPSTLLTRAVSRSQILIFAANFFSNCSFFSTISRRSQRQPKRYGLRIAIARFRWILLWRDQTPNGYRKPSPKPPTNCGRRLQMAPHSRTLSTSSLNVKRTG